MSTSKHLIFLLVVRCLVTVICQGPSPEGTERYTLLSLSADLRQLLTSALHVCTSPILPVGERQRQLIVNTRLVTCPHIQHDIIHRYSYFLTIMRKRLTPDVCMSCGSVFRITVVANCEVVRIGFFTEKQ